MSPLSTTAAVAVLAALGATGARAQWNDVPPSNDSATEPWWPQYPEDASKYDFMMNNTSNDDDLKGNSRIAKWIITTSNIWRAQFGEYTIFPATSAEGARRAALRSTASVGEERRDVWRQRDGQTPGLQADESVASYCFSWAGHRTPPAFLFPPAETDQRHLTSSSAECRASATAHFCTERICSGPRNAERALTPYVCAESL